MVFFEGLLQGVIQLFYVIFIKGSLVLIDALYKIFGFFTGGQFVNHIIGVSGDGAFVMNWDTPIASIFFYVTIGCLILGLILIGFIFAQRLLNTRLSESKNYSGLGSIPKFFILFILGIVGIPVFFIFMNLITSVLSSILGFSNSIYVGNDGIMQIKNHITGMVNEVANIQNLVISSTDLDTYLTKLIADLRLEVTNSTSTNFTDQLTILIQKLEYFQNEIKSIVQTKDSILALLAQIKPDKIDIAISNQLMEKVNYLNDLMNNFSNLTTQVNLLINNYGANFKDQNTLLYLKELQVSSSNITSGLGYYFSSNGVIYQLINGNIDHMGLFNLKMRVSGTQDFILVLQLYRLISNDPNATNWEATPSFIDTGMLITGILTCLIALFIIFMYCLYVTKRIFILAIYFVISPVIVILGMKDDGYIAANFFKTWIVKFLSIILINIAMQVALVITSGKYGISVLINEWQVHDFVKTIANIFVIIAGLIGGYTTSAMLSKMLGDDSSVMESMHDMMLLSRGIPLAAAPLKMGLSAFRSSASGIASNVAKISPITAGQKASTYNNRMQTLRGLGVHKPNINDVNTYNKYRNNVRDAKGWLKDAK